MEATMRWWWTLMLASGFLVWSYSNVRQSERLAPCCLLSLDCLPDDLATREPSVICICSCCWWVCLAWGASQWGTARMMDSHPGSNGATVTDSHCHYSKLQTEALEWQITTTPHTELSPKLRVLDSFAKLWLSCHWGEPSLSAVGFCAPISLDKSALIEHSVPELWFHPLLIPGDYTNSDTSQA